MINIFKSYFKFSFLTSLIFMLLGVILYFNPSGIITSISLLLGLFAFIFGISEIAIYLKNKKQTDTNLITGLFLSMIGLLLITNTNLIATIVPIILGICMVFIGGKKIGTSLLLKENGVRGWSYMFIIGLITLILAFIFIINPLKGAFIATKVLGIIIIIYSIIGIIDGVVLKNKVEEISKMIN